MMSGPPTTNQKSCRYCDANYPLTSDGFHPKELDKAVGFARCQKLPPYEDEPQKAPVSSKERVKKTPLEMTLEDIYALPDDCDGPGIYFLWRGVELLYIGASAEVMNRITRQVQLRNQPYCMTGKPQIPFTRWTILAFETITEAAKVEKDLIRKWMPGFNEITDGGDHVWSRHFEAEARAAQKTTGGGNV